VLVLGPVVDQKEHPHSRKALHHRVQKRLRFGVDPVKVLEHETKRLDLGFPEHQALYPFEHPLSPLGRVEVVPAIILNRDFEK